MPPATPSAGAALTILSTLGVMEALRVLAPGFERRTGLRIAADYAPTTRLAARIAAGETADLAILTDATIEVLIGEGTLLLGSRVDLARSFVGLAVRAGAPRPAIGSAAEVRQALLAARAVAYSRAGASGIFFAALIRRLDIEAAVNARAIIIPEGLTGARLASGEADLAVQQVSELMAVPGIDILGRLPAEIAGITTFAGAPRAAAARALLAHLAIPDHRPVFATRGLKPVF